MHRYGANAALYSVHWVRRVFRDGDHCALVGNGMGGEYDGH